MKPRIPVRAMALAAMGAALIAVCSWISVPTPLPNGVPFTLQTFAVCLLTALYGWKLGLGTVAVYLLLGAVGAPVFAGFKNGAAALAGPTAGYIFSYLPYAMLCGLPFRRAQDTFPGRCLMCAVGTAVCYALGTAWFIRFTGRTLAESLSLCVLPFLPGDAAKILLASLLTPRLRSAMKT